MRLYLATALALLYFGLPLFTNAQDFHFLPTSLNNSWTALSKKAPPLRSKMHTLHATAKTNDCTLTLLSSLGLVFAPKSCIDPYLIAMKISKKGFAAQKTTEEIKVPDLEVFLIKSLIYPQKKSDKSSTIFVYDTIKDVRLSVVSKDIKPTAAQFCLLRLYQKNTPLNTKNYLSIRFQSKSKNYPLLSYPKQKYLLPPLAKSHFYEKTMELKFLQQLSKSKLLFLPTHTTQVKTTKAKKEKKQAKQQLQAAEILLKKTFKKMPYRDIEQAKKLAAAHQMQNIQHIFCKYLFEKAPNPMIKSLLEMCQFYHTYLLLEETDDDKLSEKLQPKKDYLLKSHLQLLQTADLKKLKAYLKIILTFQKEELGNFMIQGTTLEEDFEDDLGNISKLISDIWEDSESLDLEAFAESFRESVEDAWDFLEEDALFQLVYHTQSYWKDKIIPQHKEFIERCLELENRYFNQLKTKNKNFAYSPKADHSPRVDFVRFDSKKMTPAEKVLPKFMRSNSSIWNETARTAFAISGKEGKKYIPAIFQTDKESIPGMQGGVLLDEQQHLIGWFVENQKEKSNVFLSPHFVLFYTEKIAKASYIKDEIEIIYHTN